MSINGEEELEETESGTVEIDGYKIEGGIPIPSIRQRKSHIWHKIEESIKIGQSVFFEDKKEAAAFTSFFHKSGIPYTSRSEGGGVRVWKLRKQNQEKKSS